MAQRRTGAITLKGTPLAGGELKVGDLAPDFNLQNSAPRSSEFGDSYGMLISGGPLDQYLARAIFVVSDAGILTHVEYVKEVAEHPDYDAALAAAQQSYMTIQSMRPAACFQRSRNLAVLC